MSHNDIIIGISYLLSLFFITGSVFIGMIKMVIGMNDMFKHGASLSTLPTLWIGIPILVPERKGEFFVKVKENQNFNHRHTLSIPRIKILI
jgi:hypothetical protein